ncbi:MAG TPA: carboxypeptidase M32 [Clostridiales bacterium]|nr:carboxypeptidase M32 [Clostridiales bacterium]
MTIDQAIQQSAMLQKKIHALRHASGLIFYDGATTAPEGAAAGRGETLGVLGSMEYELLINPETEKLLHFLQENKGELSPQQARETEILTREYEKISKIPQDEFVAFQVLINEAQDVWHKAKRNNDYPSFAPYIEKISTALRKFAAYFNPDEKPYNVWLDQYERGLNMDKLDSFFGKLKEAIVPLIKKIQDKGSIIDDSFLNQEFPVDKQRILSDYLMEVMCIDRRYCAIGETEHPFTINFNNKDVRITTKYHTDKMTNSMYSVIHEGGHALYELHTGDELQFTCLAGGISMGIHESQSRLFENFIGRSKPFISMIYPKLLELFPEQLKNISPHQFYLAVNKSVPSLIRIEADELTYCLHIMVRYEIEKMLLEGSVDVDKLPEVWAGLMKDYLGVDVPDDTHGVLQDSHWSGGSMGYFPSYAIGTAYAAQILHRMKQDINVEDIIESGNLKPIVDWLTENIYKYGSLMDPDELLYKCCNEPFDPTYYIDYLVGKFSAIYDL